MDKIKNYQDILISYLEEYSKITPVNLPDIETQVLADRKNNHFQLLRIGWQGEQYVFTVVFHFDIRDGKIWFQRNITEREVVDELMERGVSREDIVLGFRPPYARHLTGFAVA
jgi:hypothetical protein